MSDSFYIFIPHGGVELFAFHRMSPLDQFERTHQGETERHDLIPDSPEIEIQIVNPHEEKAGVTYFMQGATTGAWTFLSLVLITSLYLIS